MWAYSAQAQYWLQSVQLRCCGIGQGVRTFLWLCYLHCQHSRAGSYAYTLMRHVGHRDKNFHWGPRSDNTLQKQCVPKQAKQANPVGRDCEAEARGCPARKSTQHSREGASCSSMPAPWMRYDASPPPSWWVAQQKKMQSAFQSSPCQRVPREVKASKRQNWAQDGVC